MIVDYDPLPAVVDPEAAVESDAPVVFEAQGSNIANAMGTGPVEGVLDDADVVISVRIVNQRVAPVPMEPAGIVVEFPASPTAGSRSGPRPRDRTVFATSCTAKLGLEPEVVRGATRRSAADSARKRV